VVAPSVLIGAHDGHDGFALVTGTYVAPGPVIVAGTDGHDQRVDELARVAVLCPSGGVGSHEEQVPEPPLGTLPGGHMPAGEVVHVGPDTLRKGYGDAEASLPGCGRRVHEDTIGQGIGAGVCVDRLSPEFCGRVGTGNRVCPLARR
jgi:hypothetical protein